MKQLDMLRKMHKTIVSETIGDEEAFDSMLSYCASKFVFKTPVSVPWIKASVLAELNTLFDVEVLKEDPWDWFGELHNELGLSMIDNNFLLSKKNVALHAKHVLSVKPDTNVPIRVLDDDAYTGRNIISMHRLNPNAIYYAVESDLIPYRIALLNMKCYDIRSAILLANKANDDIRPFSPNWRDSNAWVPTQHRISANEVDARLRHVDGFNIIV